MGRRTKMMSKLPHDGDECGAGSTAAQRWGSRRHQICLRSSREGGSEKNERRSQVGRSLEQIAWPSSW